MVRESLGRNDVPKTCHSHNLKRSKDDFSARDREAKKPETAMYSKHQTAQPDLQQGKVGR